VQNDHRGRLTDEVDLGVVLLLDRDPAEVVWDQVTSTDAELRIASTDLERLLSDDIHPAMLIAGGRAEATAGQEVPPDRAGATRRCAPSCKSREIGEGDQTGADGGRAAEATEKATDGPETAANAGAPRIAERGKRSVLARR